VCVAVHIYMVAKEMNWVEVLPAVFEASYLHEQCAKESETVELPTCNLSGHCMRLFCTVLAMEWAPEELRYFSRV
jgi:hypothetical protein